MDVVNLSILPPVMSQEQFANFTGVTKDTVRGWVEARTIYRATIILADLATIILAA